MSDFIYEFKKNAVFRIKEGQRMVHLAFEKTVEEHIWKLPISNGISLGNQILHINGNMTQYIISSLGENIDYRDRNKEFEINIKYNKTELLKKLDATIISSLNVIDSAQSSNYLKLREVQGYKLSGIGVLLHAVEHFSYHVGQIAFWVKFLTKTDLEFYKDQDLNQKNN